MTRYAFTQQIIDHLDGLPGGALYAEISVALGADHGRVSGTLAILKQTGRIDSRDDPGKWRSSHRQRYYALQHLPPEKPAAKVFAKPKPRIVAKFVGEEIRPPGLVETVIPYHSDTRFTVDAVAEPYFSALRPGVYP